VTTSRQTTGVLLRAWMRFSVRRPPGWPIIRTWESPVRWQARGNYSQVWVLALVHTARLWPLVRD